MSFNKTLIDALTATEHPDSRSNTTSQKLGEDVSNTSSIAQKYKNGKFTYLIVHPEYVLEKAVTNFPKKFQKLDVLRAIFHQAYVLIMTATATEDELKDIMVHLNTNNPAVIKTSPDRNNVYFSIKKQIKQPKH